MVFARSKAEWRLAEPEPTSPAAKTPGTSVRATACSRWQENSRFLDSAVKPLSAQITAASWAPGVWRGASDASLQPKASEITSAALIGVPSLLPGRAIDDGSISKNERRKRIEEQVGIDEASIE